jgi:hypothetical protein
VVADFGRGLIISWQFYNTAGKWPFCEVFSWRKFELKSTNPGNELNGPRGSSCFG